MAHHARQSPKTPETASRARRFAISGASQLGRMCQRSFLPAPGAQDPPRFRGCPSGSLSARDRGRDHIAVRDVPAKLQFNRGTAFVPNLSDLKYLAIGSTFCAPGLLRCLGSS